MKRAGLALLVLGLAVALGEGLARLAPPPDAAEGAWAGPAPTGTASGEILLDGSPWLLWELRPGVHAEKGVTVRINHLGLRDRERGPKTRPRALALGDSSVYGFGVEDEQVFTALLEARVGADVVNAAVPGYSTYQALNLLDARGMDLDPDLLIVATLWSDNNFDSFVDRELLASYQGWEGSWTHRVRAALSTSAAFRWLDWTVRVEPAAVRARKVGWQVGGTDPRNGRRRVAIDDYAANLDAFAERMRARGGGVVYVILPNRADLRNDAADPAWGPYRAVMRDAARRWGAPLVDLPPRFRADGGSADALFLDQMHPTPRGHALMADAIAEALAAAGWPASPLHLQPAPDRVPVVDRFDGTGFAGAAP